MKLLKTIIQAFMILVFLVCLIGASVGLCVLFFNPELSNRILSFSVPIGLVNFLIIISSDFEEEGE